jgi:hypothetical protein
LVATGYEELVRPQVMTAVEDLMAREASGVLEVTGSPSGAFFLDCGRIAFARATGVPGPPARLGAVHPALASFAELSPGQDADDAAIAGFAVQHGYLTTAGLHELIGSIVIDAFLVLAIPLATDSPVAAVRFTSTRTYWTEIFPRLGIKLVRAEALRVAGRMAEHGLTPGAAVARCDLQAPTAVVTREQWAVACQIGEHASALDIAARRGAALADTLDCLAGLIQAGLCAPVRVRGHGRPPVQVPGRARQPALPTKPQGERLPMRHDVHRPPPWPEGPGSSGGPGQPPTADVLRQVLDGLRKLS